jgi:hypothetical protein
MGKDVPNLTRLKVYLCLAEGIEGKKMCGIQASKFLAISPATISYHIKQLLLGNFIQEIGEHSNPTFYARGPKANILDKLTLESNIRIDGGTVNSSNSNVTHPDESFIRTARVHNCRVDFIIDKVGDMTVFGKPYLERNGVTFWKTKVPYNGQKVSIELRESGKACKMSVWPPARDMVPEQFGDTAEKVLISEAQDIANHLAKNGGWRFGLLELKTDVEYASQDSDLLKEIPESIRTAEANGVWMDCSEGPREVETKDPEKAKIIVSIPGRIQEMEKGHKAQVDRTYVVEMKVDRLCEIMEKLVKVTEMNGEALANLAEQGVMETVEKVIHQKASANGNGAHESKSTFSEDKYEVMYR